MNRFGWGAGEATIQYKKLGNSGTTIELNANDPDRRLANLLNYIRHNGNGGHSFTIIVDPDLRENTKRFSWDGDGGDRINEIKVNGSLLKGLDYSQIHTPRLGGAKMTEEDDMMKEDDEDLEKGDSDFVREMLEDESGGMEGYSQALGKVQDPKLKEILQAIQEDEQKHNAALEQWLQENDPEALDEHEDEESPGEETAEDDEDVEAGLDDDEEEQLDKDDEKGDLIDDIRAVLEQHDGGMEKDDDESSDDDMEKGEDDDDSEDMEKDDEEDDETVKRCHKSLKVPFIKANKDQQIVYGVVSEPGTIDLQGDRISKSEIRKACHKFMMESQKIGKEHEAVAKADIIESYIAPVDFKCGGQVVKSGSWVMAVKIHDPNLWQAVKKGEITGFSIAGRGERVPFGN